MTKRPKQPQTDMEYFSFHECYLANCQDFFFFLKVVHPQNEGKNKLIFQCLCRDVGEAAMTTLQMVMSCYFVTAAAASPNNVII